MDYEKYKAILKSRLKEKRYHHSLCVADEAKRLAEKYSACDPKKAYLAGLLHDITKNTEKEEQLKIVQDCGIILDTVTQKSEKLWHAVTGAAYIENVLEISDRELTDAVRYHTTARKDMQPLDVILYLADFTSADRDYDDVDKMRELVDISLEKALCYALIYTVCDLAQNGKQIHPDTLAAYNQIIGKEITYDEIN